MAEETVAEQAADKPAKKGGASMGNILLIVVVALLSSAGGGVVSSILISRTLSAQAKNVEKPDKSADAAQEKMAALLQKSAVLPLEPFIVNLADTDSARYLRIKISLMVDDKTKLKELTENLALQLKVRDVILQTLAAKTSKDLITEEGKNRLRHEIQEKIEIYFREPKLVEVMFTEFVIQL